MPVERQSSVPVVRDTFFAESEPIVDTPVEVLDLVQRTRMERLVMEFTIWLLPSARSGAERMGLGRRVHRPCGTA